MARDLVTVESKTWAAKKRRGIMDEMECTNCAQTRRGTGTGTPEVVVDDLWTTHIVVLIVLILEHAREKP